MKINSNYELNKQLQDLERKRDLLDDQINVIRDKIRQNTKRVEYNANKQRTLPEV